VIKSSGGSADKAVWKHLNQGSVGVYKVHWTGPGIRNSGTGRVIVRADILSNVLRSEGGGDVGGGDSGGG
tara:strand:+ start:105 stop:314 length:210 start_codon:yes stop_codon:yes gene_type:complete